VAGAVAHHGARRGGAAQAVVHLHMARHPHEACWQGHGLAPGSARHAAAIPAFVRVGEPELNARTKSASPRDTTPDLTGGPERAAFMAKQLWQLGADKDRPPQRRQFPAKLTGDKAHRLQLAGVFCGRHAATPGE
jgi:hypothetical protein